MVLRDEGACERRQQNQADPYPAGDASQRGRRDGVAGVAARARRHALGGDPAYRWQTEVIQQQALQAKDCTHLRYRYKDCLHEAERAKNRTKVLGALQGRARVWDDEAEVRKGTLPRTGEGRRDSLAAPMSSPDAAH